MNNYDWNFGLLGWPLDHSLSPALHHAALQERELRGTYRLFPVPDAQNSGLRLKAYVSALRQGELDGLNVTLPFKERILSYLDQLTPIASAIGAVNMIYREEELVVGDNTDAPAFLTDLNATLSPARGVALIFGAGGSARAIAFALCQESWRVWIAARRERPALNLLEALDQAGYPGQKMLLLRKRFPTEIPDGVSLIVNATPLGMIPHKGESPWPLGIPFPNGAMVYDLVYNPQETALTQAASNSGMPAVTGLGMLVEQAALSFQRWTGRIAPRESMREAGSEALKSNERIGGS
jgi:shikimate dehydrogenase